MCSTQGRPLVLGEDGGAEPVGSDELAGGCGVPLVGCVLAGGRVEDGWDGAEPVGRSEVLCSPNGLKTGLLGGGTVVMSAVPSTEVVGGLLSSAPPPPSVRSGISITRISVTREDSS